MKLLDFLLRVLIFTISVTVTLAILSHVAQSIINHGAL